MMDKIEALFIRACKSQTPERRINRLYSMFYYRGDRPDNVQIVNILLRICEEHGLIDVRRLIDNLNPRNAWKFVDESQPYTYYEYARAVLTSEIRLTEVSKFKDYPAPAKFKRVVK